MSGDFEPWNNDPAPNQAPKLENTPYTADKVKASRFTWWIDVVLFVVLAVAAAGVLWYIMHRHH